MFWVGQAIMVSVGIPTLTACLFNFHSYYEESDNLFIFLSMALAGLTYIISYLIYKYSMPNSYKEYKTWIDNTANSSMDKLTIFLPILAYTIFFMVLVTYVNQHNPVSPVETIKTQIIDKYTRHVTRHKAHYLKMPISAGKIFKLDNEEFYDMLDVGDKVIIKVQKGNLGHYFMLEIKVEKNNFFRSF